MIAPGDRVLVAVSGGSDSAGTALVLSELSARLECELVLAHVHHGLRGAEADAGEAAAAALAAALDLPFVRADVRLEDGGNLEARARAERYRSLHELAARSSCNRVATGHTRDDQAETFLLRLLGGAGAEGLAGIRPVRADGVIRPLLDCDRDQVAVLVGQRGLPVADDSMNKDPRFLRTRVRHDLLPLLKDLNPGIVSLAARSADSLRAAAMAQDRWAATKLDADSDALSLSSLEGLPAELRAVVVRAWLSRSAPQGRLSARTVSGVEWLTGAGVEGAAVDLSPRRRVERRGDRLVMVDRDEDLPIANRPLELGVSLSLPGGWLLRSEVRQGPVPLPSDLWSAVCDLDRCGVLQVRSARDGDRIRPFGMSGTRKLARVFGDRRVPRPARVSYPVVTSGDEVLWVPGVVRAAETAVDRSTTRIAVLSAERLTVAGAKGP